MALDDAATGRQADPGTGIFLATVQAREDLEHLFVELRIDADAVVGDRECPDIALERGRDADRRRRLAAIFQGIVDQIDEQPFHLRLVRLDHGQRPDDDFGPAIGNGPGKRPQRVGDNGTGIDGVTVERPVAHSRIGEQVVDQQFHAVAHRRRRRR